MLLRTFTGKLVNPLDLKPDDIDIIDIAHSLSQQCRYGAHTSHFYSVAQHSTILAYVVPEILGGHGEIETKEDADRIMGTMLLHDACEAYITDIPNPVKEAIGFEEAIELDILARIFTKFGLSIDEYHRLKPFDAAICVNEMRALFPSYQRQNDSRDPIPGIVIEPWSCEYAERAFLGLFKHCMTRGIDYHEH